MKNYLIIELPDKPEDKGLVRSDVLLTLRLHGGRLYDDDDLVIRLASEKTIPTIYCEAREQKELRAIIEKEIAVGIAQALLERGRIKFTERLDKYGTCVRGTLAVFLEEATDGKAD